MSRVRVRFAPSPTGYVHVGNARTALFNWLFGRHHGGTFVLRIEDTDVERSQKCYEEQLLEDLRWLGLDWDEGPDKGGEFGPYRQSQRRDLYSKYATELIDRGHAYFCFCAAEQIEAEREEALKAGRPPKYSGRCRKRPREEAARKVAKGEPAVIRLKIASEEFTWNDLVHGPITFSSHVVDDPVLMRSDGHPVYNFAVVIDDHLMRISHVIRGDDHISNTPRQLAVYRALAWGPPKFGHLSTILGPDRKPLSKRHGATSIQNFREMGILPEALMNYLTLLGWSPGDGKTEILTTEELIAQFSLDRITKSPAVFDLEKLNWMNRHYMKVSPPRRLAELAVPFLKDAGDLVDPITEPVLAWLERTIDALRKNLDNLSQLPSAAQQIFRYDATNAMRRQEIRQVAQDAGSREVLSAFLKELLGTEVSASQHSQSSPNLTFMLSRSELNYHQFREIAKQVQQQTGKKGRELFHPIRVALTGEISGPELEKLIPVLEEGAKLPLAPPVKNVAQRLREFAGAAGLT